MFVTTYRKRIIEYVQPKILPFFQNSGVFPSRQVSIFFHSFFIPFSRRSGFHLRYFMSALMAEGNLIARAGGA